MVAAGLATAGVTLLGRPAPRLVWKYKAPAPSQIPAGVSITVWPPTMSGGSVYISDSLSSVIALRAADGARLWSRPIFNPSAPAAAGSAVYIAAFNGTVSALRADNGSELWRAASDPAGDNVGPPQVAVWGGNVYVARDRVHAIRASDGQVIWTASVANGGFVPITADGSAVYVSDQKADLYALRASDGNVRWRFHSAAPRAQSLTATVAGGVVYAEDDRGNLYALRASDGTTIWSRASGGLRSGASFQPAVASGAVLLGDSTDELLALDARSGTVRWRLPAQSPGPAVLPSSPSTPAAGAGMVCVTYDDLQIHALRAADGSRLWSYAYPLLGPAVPAVGSDGTVFLTGFLAGHTEPPLTVLAVRG